MPIFNINISFPTNTLWYVSPFNLPCPSQTISPPTLPSGYIPALEARAIISLQMGYFQGALLDIDAAVRLSPSTAVLLVERGVVHQYMGDIVNAMRDYQRAAQQDPTCSLAHYNMGNVILQQRLFDQVTLAPKIYVLM